MLLIGDYSIINGSLKMSKYKGQDFVDILRKIGYPKAEKFEGSSFDYMFEPGACLSFLESFCRDIGEENVLTPEELTELETLPSDDTTKQSDIFEESCIKQFLSTETVEVNDEVSDEIAFLKSEQDDAEKFKKILKLQISNLSLKKDQLAKEIDEAEIALRYERKRLRKLQDEASFVKRKFAADLKQLFSAVGGATMLMSPNSPLLSSSRNFFQLNFNPYLKTERNTLERNKSRVNTPLNETLTDCQKRTSCDPEDGLHELTIISNPKEKKLQELALCLQYLRVSQEKVLKLSYGEKKAGSSLKFYKEEFNIDRYLQTTSHLRLCLQEAKKARKRLEEKEKKLLLSVLEVIQQYIARQRKNIYTMHGEEKLTEHKALLAKQKDPLKYLIVQEDRLCSFTVLMHCEESHLNNIRKFMLNTKSILESEILYLKQREAENKDLLDEDIPSNEIYVSESSVLSSLQKLLNVEFYLSLDDLLKKASRIRDKDCKLDEKLEDKFHEQMRLVKIIENSAAYLDELLYERKWTSVVHPESLLQTAVVGLNKAHMKLQNLETLMVEEMTNYQKKEKVLQNNIIMRKSRQLFIFALTNHLRLQEALKEMRILWENRNLSRKQK